MIHNRKLAAYLLPAFWAFIVFLAISVPAAAVPPARLRIHFLDVGQGECILVQTPGGRNLLIDAGSERSGQAIKNYLAKQQVNRLDVVVGTYPQTDHIGSLDAIIRTYAIGQVYLPKVRTASQKFAAVQAAIRAKGLKIDRPAAGSLIPLDPALQVTILAPNSPRYRHFNEYSIVLKIGYGKTAFLLTGDAGRESEREMLAHGYDLRADLLKVGHHGSDSSSMGKFLAAVLPKYAVISVGKWNSFNFPGKNTLKRLKLFGASVYRTDYNGTIVAVSDGKTIQLQTSR